MVRLLRRILSKKEKPPAADEPIKSRPPEGDEESGASVGEAYVPDRPLTDPEGDRFSRRPFAERLAQTIGSRRDPSSIVIAIYGAWGEGKTTLLHFVEHELKGKYGDGVIPLWFNPWRFGDEAQLLRSFFHTLAHEVGTSISSRKEEIGKWLEDYGAFLTPSVTIAGLIGVSPGKGVTQVGKALSTVELDRLKERIEDVLEAEKKRIVIFMDDIDRLERAEIQSLFRLVKLSADFPYTAYVMAFDREIVAAALGEKYGAGDREAGRSFLEKIVQVPLQLPAADRKALVKLCFQGVDEALRVAQTDLTEDQAQAFGRHFIDGLQIRLATPRLAKRYGNILGFSLPLLKGEADPVDLMLIEGIRVFYPGLYETIRGNPDVFVEGAAGLSGMDQRAQQRKEETIERGLKELSEEEKQAAKSLLKVLFPRTGASHYGPSWDATWSRGQRIASKHYFDRFFSYCVRVGDISDLALDSFLDEISAESVEGIADRTRQLVGNRGGESFVSKVKSRRVTLSGDSSAKLATALALLGDIFPNPRTMWGVDTPFVQAGILVSQLVENVPTREARLDAARRVARKGQPLRFAIECIRWIRAIEKKEDKDRILSIEDETQLSKVVAGRVRELASEGPMYILHPVDARLFLMVWAESGSRDETNEYLANMLNANPVSVAEFLKCYVPIQWGLETGIAEKGDLGRDQYDSVSRVVDPEVVLNAIETAFGVTPASAVHEDDGDRPPDERVVHQFAKLHEWAEIEHQAAGGAAATPDMDSDQDET